MSWTCSMLVVYSIHNTMCWFYLLHKQNVFVCAIERERDWENKKRKGDYKKNSRTSGWNSRTQRRQRAELGTNKNVNYAHSNNSINIIICISATSSSSVVAWLADDSIVCDTMRVAFLFTKCKLWFWICLLSLWFYFFICKSVRRTVYNTQMYTWTWTFIPATAMFFSSFSVMINILLFLAKDIGFILSWR